MLNIEKVPKWAMMIYIVESLAEVMAVNKFGFHSVVSADTISDKDICALSEFKQLERVYIIHNKPKPIYEALVDKYFVKYIIPKKPLHWLNKGEFNDMYYFQNRLNKGSKTLQ